MAPLTITNECRFPPPTFNCCIPATIVPMKKVPKELTEKMDALYSQMQTPENKKAVAALKNVTVEQLRDARARSTKSPKPSK